MKKTIKDLYNIHIQDFIHFVSKSNDIDPDNDIHDTARHYASNKVMDFLGDHIHHKSNLTVNEIHNMLCEHCDYHEKQIERRVTEKQIVKMMEEGKWDDDENATIKKTLTDKITKHLEEATKAHEENIKKQNS